MTECFLRSVDQLFQALSTDCPEYQLTGGRGGRGDIVGNLDYRARQTQQGAIRSGSLLITDGNDRVFPKVS